MIGFYSNPPTSSLSNFMNEFDTIFGKLIDPLTSTVRFLIKFVSMIIFELTFVSPRLL